MSRWLDAGRRHWAAQAAQDRRALAVLGIVLAAALFWQGVWTPVNERLQRAEQGLALQRALTRQTLALQPNPALAPVRLSAGALGERARAAGLQVDQLDIQGNEIRLAVRGPATVVLQWLDDVERAGNRLHNLDLEREQGHLALRLSLENRDLNQ